VQIAFIYGPTASGKLTIGREVARLAGFKLFPDHLAANLVRAVFDSGMRPYIRIREWAWTEVLREAVHVNRSLVFTFTPRSTIRSSFISHICVIIERLGGDIVFIELTCPEAVIESRIESAERESLGKISNLNEYRRLRDQGAFQFRTMPTPALRIDTSTCDAAAAAQRIVAVLDV